MKDRLIALCSFVFLCMSANAQTYEDSMRYWDEGPLSWDELTLKSPRNFRTSDLVFRWATTTQKQKTSWNTVQYTPIAKVALDKSVSWHNAERIYPCALAYDQLLFDLNELYFRKMLTELYSEGNNQSANELYSFYSSQSKTRWGEIADDTEDGLDSAMVAFHAARIAEELAQTSYPDMMPTPGQFSLGIGAGMAGSLFWDRPARPSFRDWGSTLMWVLVIRDILAHVQNPVLRIERKYVPLCVEPKVCEYVIRTLQGSAAHGPSQCAIGLL